MRRSGLACRVSLFAGLVLLGGCREKRVRAAEQDAPAGAPPFTDTSPHLAEFADVDGVRLSYLDWGGMGPPLVMLHGLGDDPHVFDDLAPLLREHFHVLAYARRGHGDSDAPAAGRYDLRTLVTDLRTLLDRLRIERVSLLGWSTGGNELTRFASVAPERVDRLVYLEAGYDFADPKFQPELFKVLAASSPGEADCASLDAYRSWYQAFWLGEGPWTEGLEAYLRNSIWIDRDGRITPRMSEGVARKLFASMSTPRDYTAVQAPALALYATSFFPATAGAADREQARRVRDFEQTVMTPFRLASMERLRDELRGSIVREIDGASHMSIGVRNVQALAETVRAFLLAAP